MGNKFGNAYGLTVLIPIKHGTENNRAYDKIIRDQLQKWPLDKKSPLASVPNTYGRVNPAPTGFQTRQRTTVAATEAPTWEDGNAAPKDEPPASTP